MNDGYRSRKFWLTVVLCIQATALLSAGLIDQGTWLASTGSAIALFSAANVGEKFVK